MIKYPDKTQILKLPGQRIVTLDKDNLVCLNCNPAPLGPVEVQGVLISVGLYIDAPLFEWGEGGED